MADFKHFAKHTAKKFEDIMNHPKGDFRIDVGGRELWDFYQDAFPEGTNKIFKERREMDCQCCKSAFRQACNVVSINDDGTLNTIWDFEEGDLEEPFATVADQMRDLVTQYHINNAFLVSESRFGSFQTKSIAEDSSYVTWNHFQFDVPNNFVSSDVATNLSKINSTVGVFKRGLDELTTDAVETVQSLINDNNLYRGEEHGPAVNAFLDLKKKYDNLNGDREKNSFIWSNIKSQGNRIKNTAIGTLIEDISTGETLEKAVRKFESKVAPSNYKRPKALVTQKMIDTAISKIQTLDLEDSLQRRHATISDVSINDVLWADSNVQPDMKKSPLNDLLTPTKKQSISMNKFDDLDEIPIDKFMTDVLTTSRDLQVFVSNSHLQNFMSVTTAENPDSKNLFKWNNPFAWVYSGGGADSGIKERVKRAGGNINAKARISLAWFNTDDLDIHLKTPSGETIYYGNKKSVLDVDMNASSVCRDPVENLSLNTFQKGTYRVIVNQFSKRESKDVGFEIEFETDGQLVKMSYDDMLASKQRIHVGDFESDGKTFWLKNAGEKMQMSSVSEENWGINTESFVTVKSVMNSPNYWTPESGGNNQGNRHWFFILDGCTNPDSARGFFNEQLRSDLDEHRKVFELLGSRTLIDPVPSHDQLSGLGFSSTRENKIFVKSNNKLFSILI